MKKHLVGGVALVAMLGGSALAADFPVKAPKAAPAVAFSWTGFYVGANAGGSWSDDNLSYSNPFTSAGNSFAVCGAPAPAVAPAPTVPNPFRLSNRCSDSNSFLAGGQIGYNFQAGAVVYGIEADGAWRRLRERSFTRFGSNPTPGSPMGSVANDTAYLRSQQDSLGTVRGRLGYAPSNWLLYVTGGLAVGGVKHSVTEVLDPGNTCLPPVPNGTCRTISDSETKVGWTVGGGVELALAPQWSVGAEYLFVDLGRTILTLTPTGGFFSNTSTSTFDNQSHIARVKLNYRFGGAALITAAY
jgi:outer membrane immunogenic protein